MNKVNKLIFHTFNSLKMKAANLNSKDPLSFIESFRRAYGVQTLACNELCFVLSLSAGSLASKSVRFLFHSFTESFEMIMNYLVKPDNFNRTVNNMMFEGLEKKVVDQYDRIKELERQLEEAHQVISSKKVIIQKVEEVKPEPVEEVATQPETVQKTESKDDSDIFLTTSEIKRIDELVDEIANGKVLDFSTTKDYRILLGLKDRIYLSMEDDSKQMQKVLTEVLERLDDLRIPPPAGHIALSNWAESIQSKQDEKLPELAKLDAEYIQRDMGVLSEPIIKSVLKSLKIIK